MVYIHKLSTHLSNINFYYLVCREIHPNNLRLQFPKYQHILRYEYTINLLFGFCDVIQEKNPSG